MRTIVELRGELEKVKRGVVVVQQCFDDLACMDCHTLTFQHRITRSVAGYLSPQEWPLEGSVERMAVAWHYRGIAFHSLRLVAEGRRTYAQVRGLVGYSLESALSELLAECKDLETEIDGQLARYN